MTLKARLNEAESYAKGISKGAMLTVIWAQLIALLLTIAVCVICASRLVQAEIMTQQAIELKDSFVTDLNAQKQEKNRYQKLYDDTLAAYEEYKKTHP